MSKCPKQSFSKLPRCFENATGLGTCEYIDKRYHCVVDNECCLLKKPGYNDHKQDYGDSAEFLKSLRDGAFWEWWDVQEMNLSTWPGTSCGMALVALIGFHILRLALTSKTFCIFVLKISIFFSIFFWIFRIFGMWIGESGIFNVVFLWILIEQLINIRHCRTVSMECHHPRKGCHKVGNSWVGLKNDSLETVLIYQ